MHSQMYTYLHTFIHSHGYMHTLTHIAMLILMYMHMLTQHAHRLTHSHACTLATPIQTCIPTLDSVDQQL